MKKQTRVHPYWSRPISEGNQLLVMGGEIVSFEFPRGWIDRKTASGMSLYDREAPDNDCIFEATLLRHTPHKIRTLPVWTMLQDALVQQDRFVPREEMVEETRHGFQLVCLEYRDIYPNEDRIAVFCKCLARGLDFHILLSYAYWPEEAERLAPVWTHAIATMELGIPTEHGLPLRNAN